MIKQIQLRGISRKPSDRMTEDGGCSESLNMYVDENELASRVDQTNVTSGVMGTTSSSSYPLMYIHKMPNGTKAYIGFRSSTLAAYVNGSLLSPVMSSSIVGTPTRFASIGNTLVVYTKDSSNVWRSYYFLYKNGNYTSLGSSIPRPEVEVITVPHTSSRSGNTASGSFELPEYFYDPDTAYTAWNDAKSESSEHHADLLAAMSTLWETVSTLIANVRAQGYFTAPFFLRYALRLYDGSYIHASVPILCGASEKQWLSANKQAVGGSSPHNKGVVSLKNGFWVGLKMASYDATNWGDIVSSLDFFISSPIRVPAMNAEFSEMYVDDGTAYIRFVGEEPSLIDDNIRNEVISKGNFYKILSVSLGSSTGSVYSELLAGTYNIKNSDDIGLGENLYVKEQMPDPYRSSNMYYPTGQEPMTFNSRVLFPGVSETLTTGELFLNGLVAKQTSSSRTTKKRFICKFHISDGLGGENIVVSRGHNSALGVYSLEAGYFTDFNTSPVQHFAEDTDSTGFVSEPYAWIAYPDRRCTSVTVYYYEGNSNMRYDVIPMEPHPYLECAYAFFGLGESLYSALHVQRSPAPTYGDGIASDENRVIESPNKIFLSELENPFLFPAGNIITFSDKIVGVAITTVPLSEGQAGQFPLYVFTAGGIRTLAVNDEGKFAAKGVPANIAQHVAVEGTIKVLDQSVVFVTSRGVMLLSGYDVRCISEAMNGKHYTLESAVQTKLGGWSGSALVSDAADTTPFIAFVKDSRIAYDYNGSRLIFFKSGKGFQYVYMFNTNTWHKIHTGLSAVKILNSFPECLVAGTSYSSSGMVWDFSSINDNVAYLQPDPTKSTYGLTVTRAFDLGMPDVRKSIKSIRIRGNFNRNNAQYLLLGSFDGLNWKLLDSLRGGSYKQFKIVLMTNLDRTERISWIDVDFEPRYATKLR